MRARRRDQIHDPACPLPFRQRRPALIAAAGERAQERFVEFLTANIRNRNSRRAYAQAVREFLRCTAAIEGTQ
jgi:hypothetical protein